MKYNYMQLFYTYKYIWLNYIQKSFIFFYILSFQKSIYDSFLESNFDSKVFKINYPLLPILLPLRLSFKELI